MTKLTKSSFQGIRAHVAGSYRTESLHGKDYIVVPVVALVEGVLQGMSSSGPELALAEEFGKFPDSWNGRPVVMSHPVVDGSPVSANSPSTLEEYQIGFLFNTTLDGKKLVQEAWIDVNMAAAQGDNAKEILEALEKGEMIEVSTGYYAMIEPATGMHNNKKYQAIQRSVTPDHLAFLPVGTLGACSNADGCGAQLAVNSSKDKEFTPTFDFRVDNVPCCSSCAETGGSCTHDHGTTKMPQANSTQDTSSTEMKGDPKKYDATTIANTIAGGVLVSDAREAVSDAIKAEGIMYAYVLGMTTDKVIYEAYNSFNGSYDKYQRSYKVSVDGKVTLGDDIEKVRLMTKVVTVNADGTDATGSEEQSMNDKTNASGAPAPAANTDEKKPTVQTVTNDQGTLEVNFDADGKATGFKLTPKVVAQTAKVPQTTEEFIAQAPKEFQEVLKSSLQLHEDSKKAIIAQIKGTNRCKISDERLSAMSLQDLQEIAELANVPSFEGRALPNTNTRQEDLTFTPAPNVFEFGAPKAQDAA